MTGICYVTSVTLPYTAELVPSSEPHTGYVGKMAPVKTMDGVPLWKPPYGRVTAIDLNTGDHRWMTPVGDLADGQLHGVADDFVRNSHGCGPSTEDESSNVPMFGRFG